MIVYDKPEDKAGAEAQAKAEHDFAISAADVAAVNREQAAEAACSRCKGATWKIS